MKNHYQYYIGIRVPDKESKLLSFVKQQYHPNNRLSSPPHVTLAAPFFDQNEKALVELLAAWAAEQPPFEVVFEDVGSFNQPKYATVFLAPNKGEELKGLHSSLTEHLQKAPTREIFIPHLTLAQRVDKALMAQIKKEIKDYRLSIKLKVKELCLYRREKDGNWEVFKTLPMLKKGSFGK